MIGDRSINETKLKEKKKRKKSTVYTIFPNLFKIYISYDTHEIL